MAVARPYRNERRAVLRKTAAALHRVGAGLTLVEQLSAKEI